MVLFVSRSAAFTAPLCRLVGVVECGARALSQLHFHLVSLEIQFPANGFSEFHSRPFRSSRLTHFCVELAVSSLPRWSAEEESCRLVCLDARCGGLQRRPTTSRCFSWRFQGLHPKPARPVNSKNRTLITVSIQFLFKKPKTLNL